MSRYVISGVRDELPTLGRAVVRAFLAQIDEKRCRAAAGGFQRPDIFIKADNGCVRQSAELVAHPADAMVQTRRHSGDLALGLQADT